MFSFSELSVGAVTYNSQWVGLEHYKYILFVDPDFRKTVVNSISEMIFNVPVVVLFSFFIASILNQKFVGRTVFRSILFLPVILSFGLITTLTAGDFLNSTMKNIGSLSSSSTGSMFSGSFTDMLEKMNVNHQLISFIQNLVERIADITNMSAVPTVIFLSGMQSISPSIYEASYIEGASSWDVFWKISFPMVSPLILVNVVYCIVDSFTSASNDAITTIHSTMFSALKYGRGSAMAMIYLAIIGLLIAIVYLCIRRLIYYYD